MQILGRKEGGSGKRQVLGRKEGGSGKRQVLGGTCVIEGSVCVGAPSTSVVVRCGLWLLGSKFPRKTLEVRGCPLAFPPGAGLAGAVVMSLGPGRGAGVLIVSSVGRAQASAGVGVSTPSDVVRKFSLKGTSPS